MSNGTIAVSQLEMLTQSGTGTITINPPNTDNDRVLTLPDESGTVDTLQRSGNVIQVVNFQTGAVATGTTVIPNDNTIPQITEGNEYMTLAITPTSASNILLIGVVLQLATNLSSPGANMYGALFRDAVTDAFASGSSRSVGANQTLNIIFNHRMVAPATSAITFRVRAGAEAAGTTTFNGVGGASVHGGVMSSSITITEYTA